MLFSHVRLVFIITSQSAFWPVIITSECVQDCLGKKGLATFGNYFIKFKHRNIFLAPSTINVAQTNNTTDVHLTSRQVLCLVN